MNTTTTNDAVVVYVEMSTIDAETSETIKRVIEKDQRAEYLAAPVSGGEKDAKEGALLILAAAERRTKNVSSISGAWGNSPG